MTAAATGISSPTQPGARLVGTRPDDVRVFQGTMVGLARYGENAGRYVPASDDPSILVLGQATSTSPPEGMAFDDPLAMSNTVVALRGPSTYAVDGGITEADRGSLLYVVDDQTLSLDSDNNLRPVAGPCLLVEADGTKALCDIGSSFDAHGELLERVTFVAGDPEAWEEGLVAASLTATWNYTIEGSGPVQLWWRTEEAFVSPGGGVFGLSAGLVGGAGDAILASTNVRAAGNYLTAMPAAGFPVFKAPGQQVSITLTDAADQHAAFTAGRLVVEVRRAR